MKFAWAMLKVVAGAFVLGLVFALLAAFGLWVRVLPTAGEWTARVPVGPLTVEVGVLRVMDALTDPRFAPWIARLEGRTWPTPAGPLSLRHDTSTHTLHLRCAPCRLHAAAFGDVPLVLAELELSVRREGERRWQGSLASGGVRVAWRARPVAATPTVATARGRGGASTAASGERSPAAPAGRPSGQSLELHFELPETRLDALYALLGEAVPELQRARIDGTLALVASLRLPEGRWRVEPLLRGFEVHGLGTEALAHVEPPSQCLPLPRRVSPWLERAVVAAEDQRFFDHPGYDLAELRRALAAPTADVRVRGASTITQQLAKLLYVGDERSVVRKARELLYAVEMERTLGKGRILRLYLAVAPWGDGLCGAQAASRAWFGSGAAALDAQQAAWLALRLRRPDAPVDWVTPERVARLLDQVRARARARVS